MIDELYWFCGLSFLIGIKVGQFHSWFFLDEVSDKYWDGHQKGFDEGVYQTRKEAVAYKAGSWIVTEDDDGDEIIEEFEFVDLRKSDDQEHDSKAV